jgi:hypothetical protein
MTKSKALVVQLAFIFLGLNFWALTAPTMGADKMSLSSSSWPANKVLIAPNAILMPPGKILLLRKETSGFGAIRFLNFWSGNTDDDRYAEYESYYQPRLKDGHLGGQDLVVNKGKLSSPKPWGIGRLSFSFGKKEIRCGPVKLYWAGKGSVYFYSLNQKEGDYGIELAPTNWSDISEVDFSDSSIRWYRYDSARQRTTIFIDQFWPTDKNE